jgi:uncharacterized protein YdhG (YjbR/CyaY superfamily)
VQKAKSRARATPAKTSSGPKNFEEYAAQLREPDALDHLIKMRAAIRSVVPKEATETISYRIPAFRHKGILVWFAAFAEHCSLFPTAAIVEAFKNDLKNYSTSKGTIHFPNDKPLPIALIKKMVRARVKQNQSKARR